MLSNATTEALGLVSGLLLSAVFMAAGLGKLTDRAGTRKAVKEFGAPGTVAVPGGVGLCCPKGKPNCCKAFDSRADDDDLASLGLKKGTLCVNGSSRKG